MNETLVHLGRELIKQLLTKCSEKEHLIFKRMYSPSDLTLPINDVVDRMDDDLISHALTQCENTIQ